MHQPGARTSKPRPSLSRNRILPILVLALAAGTAVAMFWLWPRDTPDVDRQQLRLAEAVAVAEVTGVTEDPCSFAPEARCRLVEFTIVDGPNEGLTTWQQFEIGQFTPGFDVGEHVVLNVIENNEIGTVFEYSDRDRRPVLVGLLLAFSLAVVALGRMRGAAALLGLVVSVLVLVLFIAPSILAGNDPVLVATVGGSAIALTAIYMAHGWRAVTHVAVLGTFAALAIALGLSWLVAAAANFSGFASEEAVLVSLLESVDVGGLILAGAVLGAIGALDDVTVTQASTMIELHDVGTESTTSELYRRGLRVGRDHVAATVNTLLLAYVGASLPLVLLYSLSGLSFDMVANSEVIAIEVVRTLVGSIGLVAAVPITTWLASWALTRASADATAVSGPAVE